MDHTPSAYPPQRPETFKQSTDDYTILRSHLSLFAQKKHYRSFSMFGHNEQQIIIRYGKYLDVDLNRHKSLFYLVLSALTSNLPLGWSENINHRGVIFFRDPMGNEYKRHPMDSFYKTIIASKRRMPSCLFWLRQHIICWKSSFLQLVYCPS